MVDLGDPNQLARRAEVLQRIADQLASQLDVERRSNEALRMMTGEPPALRAGEDGRAATRRFMTFAAVAVVTAAAVAALVARPWRSSEVHLSGPPDVQLQAPMELTAIKSALVPFSVVSAPRPAYFMQRSAAQFEPLDTLLLDQDVLDPSPQELPYVP